MSLALSNDLNAEGNLFTCLETQVLYSGDLYEQVLDRPVGPEIDFEIRDKEDADGTGDFDIRDKDGTNDT